MSFDLSLVTRDQPLVIAAVRGPASASYPIQPVPQFLLVELSTVSEDAAYPLPALLLLIFI